LYRHSQRIVVTCLTAFPDNLIYGAATDVSSLTRLGILPKSAVRHVTLVERATSPSFRKSRRDATTNITSPTRLDIHSCYRYYIANAIEHLPKSAVRHVTLVERATSPSFRKSRRDATTNIARLDIHSGQCRQARKIGRNTTSPIVSQNPVGM